MAEGGNSPEEAIVTQPQFIRQFSKDQSPEQRQQLAKDIRAKRGEYFTQKKGLTEQSSSLNEQWSGKFTELTARLEQLASQETLISNLSESWFSRVIHHRELKNLSTNSIDTRAVITQIQADAQAIQAEEQRVSAQLNGSATPEQFAEARKMVNGFYDQEKQKWADTPYSKEEIKRYFSEEHLASLSMEDYMLLLRRFPSEMVTHVTRQGVVDKANSEYTATMNEYNDGFMAAVRDGRLRSGIGVFLKEGLKKGTILDARVASFDSKQKALGDLDNMLNPIYQPESGSYADFGSIHFAAESVSDAYYGCERGNEIFFVFPSSLIASEYFSGGNLTGTADALHNDVWVWTEEQKGMDLNAGIIFIPKDARVDPRTGSRYQLDEAGRPRVNAEYISTLRKVAENPEFDQLTDDISRVTQEFEHIIDQKAYEQAQVESQGRFDDRFYERRHQLQVQFRADEEQDFQTKLDPYRTKLTQEFGVTDPKLVEVLLREDAMSTLRKGKINELQGIKQYDGTPHTIDDYSRLILSANGILFVEAQTTIPSQEFWENYISQNPSQKLSKVVYYEGDDPTTAFIRWKQENGLTNQSPDSDLGFPENQHQYGQTGENTPLLLSGSDRFRSLMEEVIDEYFANRHITA